MHAKNLRFFRLFEEETRPLNLIWALFYFFRKNAQSTQIVNEKFVHYFIRFSLYFFVDPWYTNHRRTTIYCVVAFLSLLNVGKACKEEKEVKKVKIIKRNGSEATFDRIKICRAIQKANESGDGKPELTARQIDYISFVIEDYCNEVGRALSVEEIQELVESLIIQQNAPETAKRYIRYRFTRNLARQANTTDGNILSLIECNNEEYPFRRTVCRKVGKSHNLPYTYVP